MYCVSPKLGVTHIKESKLLGPVFVLSFFSICAKGVKASGHGNDCSEKLDVQLWKLRTVIPTHGTHQMKQRSSSTEVRHS